MGKITFYCTICAGPLYEWEHRKLSLAQPGDDTNICFDDACDCDFEEESDSNGNSPSGEESSKHAEYCASKEGYWGDILPESDIAWLARPRMLRARGGENIGGIEAPDDGSLCYLTDIGAYDPYEGLEIPGGARGLWANQDGFLLHDACWKMLYRVHDTIRPGQNVLTPHEVYLTMLSKLDHEMDSYISWGDERLYGGAEEFAEQEWRPFPGYEWVVADPEKQIDFAELISQSIGISQDSVNGHRQVITAPSSSSVDPFSGLPMEVHLMILQLLPSYSVLDLFCSSRTFRVLSANLPPAFWKSRIGADIPWMEGTSLQESIAHQSNPINYRALLRLLKEAGGSPRGGRNDRRDPYLALKNRRRIWICCEAILDIMGLGKKDAGSVSSEMEALATPRIARLCQPKEGSKLVNYATFFYPTTLDNPILRSVTVYFSPQAWIVGIEWSLEGESSGRLFGTRATALQSVALAPDLVITGFLLALGSPSNGDEDRTAWGLGILSEDNPIHPRIRLGRWSDDDLVNIFQPAKNQPTSRIVGITGQCNGSQILTFGILTADLQNKTPRCVLPVTKNMDIYSRWLYPHLPYSDGHVGIRYGIDGFPRQELTPFNPPILENPAMYMKLRDRQILSVEAYFPLGAKKEFGGFRFRFVDGGEQLVGKNENHETLTEGQSVIFNSKGKEQITGIIYYFDSNASRTTPSRFHGLEFCTSNNRKLGLGWLDAWSDDYRRESHVANGEVVVGLHFGIKSPVIESMGLVVA